MEDRKNCHDIAANRVNNKIWCICKQEFASTHQTTWFAAVSVFGKLGSSFFDN